jgi:hypothetical protein
MKIVRGLIRDGAMDKYLEIINDTLAIQEVIYRGEEIPAQRLAPWILASIIHGFRIHERKQSSDLTIHKSLAKKYKNDNANMTHE